MRNYIVHNTQHLSLLKEHTVSGWKNTRKGPWRRPGRGVELVFTKHCWSRQPSTKSAFVTVKHCSELNLPQTTGTGNSEVWGRGDTGALNFGALP